MEIEKRDCAWGCARKHHLRKSSDRKAQISPVSGTNYCFVLSIWRFPQVVFIHRAQPHIQSLFSISNSFCIKFDHFFDEKKDGSAENSIACIGASIPCHLTEVKVREGCELFRRVQRFWQRKVWTRRHLRGHLKSSHHGDPAADQIDRLYYYGPGTRFGASRLFDRARSITFCAFLRHFLCLVWLWTTVLFFQRAWKIQSMFGDVLVQRWHWKKSRFEWLSPLSESPVSRNRSGSVVLTWPELRKGDIQEEQSISRLRKC